MEEVIWDYQLIANPESDEMDVMFVVIKNDIVEQMTGAVQAVGLDPILVDVAPAACYNAARANHVGDEDCAMVLNIGGRSTNLLFADKTRFFARTIPIAGHSITQQIGKEFGIGFAEAEELKRRHGFVALGGAYAEPESEVAASVSKIIRNVMARLHGEINRSISVYRAHQKGHRPMALYLTGGSSTMTYTDHFFSEKLRMEAKYLNPFQVINIGPTVNRQQLQEVAHMFSEVIGLGLRHRLRCPIEVSLIPDSIRRHQTLQKKKPYFFACLGCLVLLLFVALLATQQRANKYRAADELMASSIQKLDTLNQEIMEAREDTDRRLKQYMNLKSFLQERLCWPDILNKLQELKPETLWVYSIRPLSGDGVAAGGGGGGRRSEGMGEFGAGMMFPGAPGGGGASPAAASGGAAKLTEVKTLEICGHSIMLESRPTGLRPAAGAATVPAPEKPPAAAAKPLEAAKPAETPKQGDAPVAEGESAPKLPVLKEGPTPELTYLARLRACPLFDPDEKVTNIQTYIAPNVVRNLSSFTIVVKLKTPVKFYVF